MGSSYSNLHSIRDIFENKATTSMVMKDTGAQFKKTQNFSVNTRYVNLKITGKRLPKVEESAQILDLDFESADTEAADFEKDIIKVLNTHMRSSKWDE
mmetsp:Transcript_5192/g.4970  ORF Transcript_5192/g.4970 Transcript_5192/m.4970 type:complete len:98 (-) Transcript_5192:499-792(-)